MGGSHNSTPANTSKEIRFASYIESKHEASLAFAVDTRKAIINNSPYEGYTSPEIDTAFLSLGIVLENTVSVYDTFGKTMAGLDIDSLFSTNFSEKMATSLSENVVESELAILDDAIEQDNRSKISVRDLNSCQSSSFIIARANIEKDRIKKTTDFRISIKYSLIPGIVNTWTATLNWDKKVLTTYAEALKDYYLCKQSVDEAEYKKKTENTIWPFTVLDFERTVFLAMRGTTVSRVMTKRERANLSKCLLVASTTLTGAQIGSRFGTPGTMVGGSIGFVIGVAQLFFE